MNVPKAELKTWFFMFLSQWNSTIIKPGAQARHVGVIPNSSVSFIPRFKHWLCITHLSPYICHKSPSCYGSILQFHHDSSEPCLHASLLAVSFPCAGLCPLCPEWPTSHLIAPFLVCVCVFNSSFSRKGTWGLYGERTYFLIIYYLVIVLDCPIMSMCFYFSNTIIIKRNIRRIGGWTLWLTGDREWSRRKCPVILKHEAWITGRW